MRMPSKKQSNVSSFLRIRRAPNIRTGLLLVTWLAALQTTTSAATYQLVDLGATNDDPGSYASAINEAGVVAGVDYSSPDQIAVPALFVEGTLPHALGGRLPAGDGQPFAINASNQVAGVFHFSDGNQDAVVFTDTRVIRLKPAANAISQANGINDAGDVVGYFSSGGPGEAFLYSKGRFHNLGFLPGDDFAIAYGINRKGQITGGSSNGRYGNFRAFLYQHGKMTTIAGIKGRDLFGYSISDRGDIAGVSYVANLRPSSRAFICSGGILTQFGPLRGDKYCSAFDINSFGQAVGSSSRIDLGPGYVGNSSTAFVYTDGHLLDLNALVAVPGWRLIDAVGINDRGQIAATARTPQGFLRAVRLDPVATIQFAGPSSRSTSSRNLKLKGAAAAASGIARVEYRVGKKGHYRLASGTSQWRATAKLKRGMNRLSLRAIAVSGEASLPVGLNVNVR